MTDSEVKNQKRNLRESVAALEHEQWEQWSRTVAEQGLTPDRIERWSRYWVPYDRLDEPTKDHDRAWADKVLALVVDHLRAQVLALHPATPSEVYRIFDEVTAARNYLDRVAGLEGEGRSPIGSNASESPPTRFAALMETDDLARDRFGDASESPPTEPHWSDPFRPLPPIPPIPVGDASESGQLPEEYPCDCERDEYGVLEVACARHASTR